MNTLVSIIIPNWNGRDLLEDCLESLKKQTFKNFEIIVVDNGSKDYSIEGLTNNYPEIVIVKLDKNYGFAKAINAGVKKSECEFMVFLNNDTVADKDWLKNLVDCAQKYPEVISVNSKLLNFYDRKKVDGLGIEINEVGQARSIGWEMEDLGQFCTPFYIFGATGGASIFRRDKFIGLEMFDEDFFMYSEEVDFAFRAQFKGYKSLFCPAAVVYHKHKASASKRPQHVEYWQFKNMMQTIIKNYPTKLLTKKWRWLKIFLVYLNTTVYQIKNGFYWPPVLTFIWLLFNLPNLLAKRRKIQKNISVDIDYIESFLISKKITFWGISK